MLNFIASPVYLACGATDMRKSIDGLAAMVQEQFGLNPFSLALFVFCNRRRDKLKILHWDHAGFWLYYRRLERGSFQWPAGGTALPIPYYTKHYPLCSNLDFGYSRY
ncbi:IS66 family insertion sequence element accessory protein TnpB [Paenibacillus popilliae]|uniref:Transposase and inactivated derivative n=2 Tax=Paenibacillus popilliae ATCC 14706 TaxID=1212764 RepID=M9LQ71_PAEPP|nr:IS66 family insertion sequence element accessory protein TnpB [Paenibacillus popilliae]GAC42876.1 transposase and inactivated derivative [Paenibacillus popilliae ATCC 14706]